MNLGKRPLPWWFAIVAAVLIAMPVLVQVYFHLRFPLLLSFVGYAALYVLAIDSIVSPGRGRLERRVTPAAVYAVEYDSGSRLVLEQLIAAPLTETWSFLVVQRAGLEVWSLERDPQLAGIVGWSALTGVVATSTAGRWGVGTVEVLPPEGDAMYFDVRVRLLDRIRRRGPNAQALVNSLTERLVTAQPLR